MSHPHSIYSGATGGSAPPGILLFDNDASICDDAEIISKSYEKYTEHFLDPISRSWSDPSLKFYNLKSEWEKDTIFLSSISEICTHPSYQRIIGMGPVALPFIMNEIAEKPNLWFWALKAITGEDPVPISKRGKILKMTTAWLIWWANKKNEIQ